MKSSVEKKRRTRRAVNARRSLEQRARVADEKYEEWMCKLDQALSKVKFYRRELQRVRNLQAREASDAVFGEVSA